MTLKFVTFSMVIALAACAKHPATSADSPATDVSEEQLPTWDEVASAHPGGATDKPTAVLVIRPDGACHKRWQSPFLRRSGVSFLPHVEDCAQTELGCGTLIQCPPEAKSLLDAFKASESAALER